jgi:hypothetical protein
VSAHAESPRPKVQAVRVARRVAPLAGALALPGERELPRATERLAPDCFPRVPPDAARPPSAEPRGAGLPDGLPDGVQELPEQRGHCGPV